MKFKALVSAVALAAAGVAHADINISTANGAAETFVTVFNSKASIVIDLGYDQDSFETNLSAAKSFNLAADANWANFLSASNGGGTLMWSVQSVDGDNNNGWLTSRVGEESRAGTTAGTLRANVGLDSGYADWIGNFINNVNTDGTIEKNVSTVGLAGTSQYWGQSFDEGFLATGFLHSSNAVGSTGVSLFNFRDNVNDPFNAAAKYDWKKGVNTAGLSNDYVLTFQGQAVTPSVPEPESLALALVGLAAIGLIARRKA